MKDMVRIRPSDRVKLTTIIDGEPWIISVQDLRILSKQEIYYRLNE